jgi:hypothetical protein
MMRESDKAHLPIPKGLRKNILLSIRKEERRRARLYLFVATIVVPSSIFGAWFAILYMAQEFLSSNFYTYLSLLFSDTDIVFMYWQQFALSLAESIPLIGATVFLMTLAIFLASIRVLVSNVRGSFTPLFNHS